jgi:hypothetical protein
MLALSVGDCRDYCDKRTYQRALLRVHVSCNDLCAGCPMSACLHGFDCAFLKCLGILHVCVWSGTVFTVVHVLARWGMLCVYLATVSVCCVACFTDVSVWEEC